MACTGYPACRNTRPVPLGVKCPKCGTGDLAEKRARKGGRKFYGCSRYPECDFTAWNRPVAETCGACGNVGLEVKETKTKGTFRRCLKCGTEFADAEATAAAQT
jgi:DNA topoisomerase-1